MCPCCLWNPAYENPQSCWAWPFSHPDPCLLVRLRQAAQLSGSLGWAAGFPITSFTLFSPGRALHRAVGMVSTKSTRDPPPSPPPSHLGVLRTSRNPLFGKLCTCVFAVVQFRIVRSWTESYSGEGLRQEGLLLSASCRGSLRLMGSSLFWKLLLSQ